MATQIEWAETNHPIFAFSRGGWTMPPCVALSAREMLEFWELDAEWVTLSACETALGRAGGGDGLLGFAQDSLTAGARAVCLSLWKVDDSATALRMIRFYQNLLGKRPDLNEPMSKAAALAEAKRWLRELSSEEALQLTAEVTSGVVRGERGKGETLKLVAPTWARNHGRQAATSRMRTRGIGRHLC